MDVGGGAQRGRNTYIFFSEGDKQATKTIAQMLEVVLFLVSQNYPQ